MRRSERLEKQQEVNVVEVRTSTWSKDSHGLFDYESKNCLTQKFKLWAPDSLLYRNKHSSSIVAHDLASIKQQDLGSEFTLLTRIFTQKLHDEIRYYVGGCEKQVQKKDSEHMHTEESMSNEVTKQDAYLIVRSLKNIDGTYKGHVLQVGQRIKLGRVEYSVIQMKTHDKKQVGEASTYSFFKNQTKYQNHNTEMDEEALCKICMEGVSEDPDNFLLNPCKCSGSCKYIHMKCLQNWIFFKVRKQVVGGTAYYHFNKFGCQICGHQLPRLIVRNQMTYELLSIERPEGSYLILEEVGEQKKDLIVIKNISELGISLGRGHQCEIRIHDISVSRQHAQIILKNDKFIILDKQSKFGTLVKLNQNMPIDNTRCSFQVGRTVLSFTVKKEKLDTLSKESMQIEQIPPTPAIQSSQSATNLKKKTK